jgi:hypothetical protein
MEEIKENPEEIPAKKWYQKAWLWWTIGVILFLVALNVTLGLTLGWDKAKIPWDFLSDQVLGMKWLNYLLGLAITGIGGTFAGDSWQYRVESSVQFFVYDFIKIGILALRFDFPCLLYSVLFPARKNQEDLGQVPWHRGQYHRRPFRHGDAVLLLLIHSHLHRLYPGGPIERRDFLFLNFEPARGFRILDAARWLLWLADRDRLRPCWAYHRRRRRDDHRSDGIGESGQGFRQSGTFRDRHRRSQN